MDLLTAAETWVRWMGVGVALTILITLAGGIVKGLNRETGRVSGSLPNLLKNKLFYILASLVFFGISILLWKPLPIPLSTPVRVVMLVLGGVFFYSGWGLV